MIYAKDPLHMINVSQRIRSYVLFEKMNVRNIAKQVIPADNRTFTIDRNVRLIFSKPYPHGRRGTPLGYVIMTIIDIDGYRIMHASDTQGPIDYEALQYIVENKPDVLIISGPPTYLKGYRVRGDDVERGLANLEGIVSNMNSGSTIIVDHHMLRDLNYRDYLENIYRLARERNVRVLTAAEYMGVEIELLEAMRRRLWGRGDG